MITAKQYDGREVMLVDSDDNPVALDARLVSRGEEFTLLSATPPHKSSSTGRVYVESNIYGWKQEYFPAVFGLCWSPAERGPQTVHLQVEKLSGGNSIVRPEGACGTCGWSPKAWQATYVLFSETPREAFLRANLNWSAEDLA